MSSNLQRSSTALYRDRVQLYAEIVYNPMQRSCKFESISLNYHFCIASLIIKLTTGFG